MIETRNKVKYNLPSIFLTLADQHILKNYNDCQCRKFVLCLIFFSYHFKIQCDVFKVLNNFLHYFL